MFARTKEAFARFIAAEIVDTASGVSEVAESLSAHVRGVTDMKAAIAVLQVADRGHGVVLAADWLVGHVVMLQGVAIVVDAQTCEVVWIPAEIMGAREVLQQLTQTKRI